MLLLLLACVSGVAVYVSLENVVLCCGYCECVGIIGDVVVDGVAVVVCVIIVDGVVTVNVGSDGVGVSGVGITVGYGVVCGVVVVVVVVAVVVDVAAGVVFVSCCCRW